MGCDFCIGEDGEELYPIYGVAPHEHVGDSVIGSTVLLPREQWPKNFLEDIECPGLGTWFCPECGSE